MFSAWALPAKLCSRKIPAGGTFWNRPVMISGMHAKDEISARQRCFARPQFARSWSMP